MKYFLTHIIIFTVIRALIYLSIWKFAHDMPVLQVFLLLFAVVMVVLVVAMLWRLFFRRRYY